MNSQLPPYITTGDPGSFAWRTIEQRKPNIIDQVLAENEVQKSVFVALNTLKDEIKNGRIRNPFHNYTYETGLFESEEKRIWEQQISLYEGKRWLEIPWYFAESFFYLVLLLAWGYYTAGGTNCQVDPFQKSKDRELYVEKGGLDLGKQIASIAMNHQNVEATLTSLLLYSLWGNRIDLSNYYVQDTLKGRIITVERENLVQDDVAKLVRCIGASSRIDIVLDNCGPELVCDLMFVWFLLSNFPVQEIHLHAKKTPFFVSDAMKKDIDDTIEAFSAESRSKEMAAVAGALNRFRDEQRIHVHTHVFWSAPLHFTDFPRDLRSEIAGSDLIILKGDANYRRLLSDRKWKPWTAMSEITGYFPVSFAVLRTMKSEIVVNLDRRTVERNDRERPDWMISGELGIAALELKTNPGN